MISALPSNFVVGALPPKDYTQAYWFIFQKYRLLVCEKGNAIELPRADSAETLPVPLIRSQYIGRFSEIECFSAESDAPAPDGMAYRSLRGLYRVLDDDTFWIAGRAIQIMDWDRTHQFCGRCGVAMKRKAGEHAKVCPQCKAHNYPRLAPAIIVAVTKGDQILLAHNARNPHSYYSVLAGFVEPGESLEQTVAREVKEEVGIDVTNIRYFGSQPWPFPHSLMLAFTAEYAGGELVLQDDEIDSADWYTVDNLPTHPQPPSVSSALIQWFINNRS